MINRNVDEYKLIRQEMINLKDCITKYIGYVFAGSGAMIYGLANANRYSALLIPTQTNGIPSTFSVEVAFISASYSILVSFVLLTLFYKFNSHNRFSGFCKLLNHERHTSFKDEFSENKVVGSTTELKKNKSIGNEKEPPLFSWEILVGDLRWLESKTNYLVNIINMISLSEPTKRTLREKLEERIEVNGKKPSVDNYKNIQGLLIIVKTILLRNTQTDSWGFPPLVVCTFLFMVFGFLGASVFMASQIGFLRNLWLLSYLVFIAFVQLCLWWYFCGRLYSLMSGSATVYSFYWKFIPLRALFLNKQRPKIRPGYISIEDIIFPESSNPVIQEQTKA